MCNFQLKKMFQSVTALYINDMMCHRETVDTIQHNHDVNTIDIVNPYVIEKSSSLSNTNFGF